TLLTFLVSVIVAFFPYTSLFRSTSITSTIGTLQLFDEVQNITGGGPANATTILSQYIYNLSYKFTPNFGYAAAVSFVIVSFVVSSEEHSSELHSLFYLVCLLLLG